MYDYEDFVRPRGIPEWDRDPPPPPGGWPKPKGWTADDELWSEDVRFHGVAYANQKAAERRAAKETK